MKKIVITFLILFGVFSIGLFFGEWLIDKIFDSSRDSLKIEIIQSILIGCLVALLFVFGSKSLKKRNK